MTSTKPYLIRAIYQWILDNDATPHLVVDAAYPGAQLPVEYVEDGRLVLNISPAATRNLLIGNDWVEFNARFGGVPRDVVVPTEAVLGIFTRENGQGMVFPDPEHPAGDEDDSSVSLSEMESASVPALHSVADDGPKDHVEKPAAGKDRKPHLTVVK